MRHQTFCIKSGEWLMVALAFMTPISTAAVNLIVGALFLCWLIAGNYRAHIQQALSHTLVRGFLLMMAVYGVSAAYSIAPTPDLWTGLREATKWGLLFLFLPFCLSPKVLPRALAAFVVAMLLTLLLGTLKWLGVALPIGGKFSAAAVFKNHIITSYFMAFAIFCLLQRAYYQKAYRWVVLGLSVWMLFYLFFMSAGRTGYVLTAFLLILFAWQHARWKGILVAVPLLASLIGAAAYFSDTFASRLKVSEEMNQHGIGRETSLGLRVEFATTSWQTFMEHPWIGNGVGSFASVYESEVRAEGREPTRNPHNTYLHIGVELGLLGLSVLLLLWHRLIQCARFLSAPYRAIAAGFIGSFMIGCLGNTLLLDFSERHFFSWMVAVLFASIPTVKKLPSVSQGDSWHVSRQ